MSEEVPLFTSPQKESRPLTALEERIKRPWFPYVETLRGWDAILFELDQSLAALDPAYEIQQVKEKFGGLRYYASGNWGDEGGRLIEEAEQKAGKTCELCGTTEGVSTDGTRRTAKGWIGWVKTLCLPCRERYAHLIKKEGQADGDQ